MSKSTLFSLCPAAATADAAGPALGAIVHPPSNTAIEHPMQSASFITISAKYWSFPAASQKPP
jgi:hypothetical protein